jgi:HD superfamily phosphodiesterase
MARLDDLWHKVESLYSEKLASREDWADWLYPNHVVIVTHNAKAIAAQKGANVELSQAAALLHDIADYMMERSNPKHEEEKVLR